MTSHATGRSTVAPDPSREAQLRALHDFLDSAPRGQGRSAPYLVSPAGERQEMPYEVFALLSEIVGVLAEGRGVSVVPTGTQLTTQQAADFLGISRPTLVKLLEQGHVPFTRIGRHRRVALEDLLEYETSLRGERREALTAQTREAAAEDSYSAMPSARTTR